MVSNGFTRNLAKVVENILIENDFEKPFIVHIEKKLSRTCFAYQALSTTET